MRAHVSRYLDFFASHPRLKAAGYDSVVRARVWVVLASTGVAAAIMMAIDHAIRGPIGQGIVLAVCALVGVGLFALLRTTGRFELVGNVTAGLIFAAITGGVIVRGGAGAPGQFAYGIIPLVATICAGWRSGVGWSVVIAIEIVVLLVIRYAGIELPVLVPLESQRQTDGWLAIVFTASVAAIGLTFEWYRWHTARAREAAEAAHMEADRARQRAIHEAALERVAHLGAVEKLTAIVGHEINNPLTYVIASLETAIEQVDPHVREMLEDALDGTRRVAKTVSNFGAIAEAPDEVNIEPSSVRRLIEEATQLTQNELRHRARVQVLGDATVEADKARLVQAFVHLLVHAARSIPPGRVDSNHIWIRVASEETDVEVTIRDSGKWRDPRSATELTGGRGLGLAVARQIVEGLSGTFEMGPDDAGGTCVTLRFRKARPTERSLGTLRVLAVDDEPLLLRSVARALKDCDVDTAGSGPEALTKLGGIDVVLCDVMMPDMSGLELYQRATELRPELAHRFVFVTGGVFDGELSAAVEGLGLPILYKPWEAADLIRVVVAAVRESDTIPPEAR